MNGHWFTNAIIYGVNIPSFQDSNGDGFGDLTGVTNRLDYLAELGVNCLWLLPFYASPRRDNGYDVSNYYAVDPRLGTIDDFRNLADRARELGIRIIVDLVVHHTSDRHPWFEAAKSDRKSAFRDYYVWSDHRPETGPGEQPAFPGAEDSVWHYEPMSRSYYHHAFYHFQPDLNFANTRVQEEVLRIMDFWLAMGVSGFRLDAAPLIIGRKGLPGTEIEPHHFWNRIRAWLNHRQPDAVMLAEANIPMTEIENYINSGHGIHMLLNFWSNRAMVSALASHTSLPLTSILDALPVLPGASHYVNFWRNLDELNLEHLPESEAAVVYREFGPDPEMQIYNRGLRRRLAPILGGDQARLRLAYSLLFAMPGVPMLVYGDEIGMGENLALEERDSVRTPMQWDTTAQAGFSIAGSSSIIHRLITTGAYGFERVNVTAQRTDPNSLWHFLRVLISTRKRHEVIGTEAFTPLEVTDPAIVGIRYHNAHTLIILHNLSDHPVTAQLPGHSNLRRFKEILTDHHYDPPKSDEVKLGRYGFRWFYG